MGGVKIAIFLGDAGKILFKKPLAAVYNHSLRHIPHSAPVIMPVHKGIAAVFSHNFRGLGQILLFRHYAFFVIIPAV
jgi:hypothetical protein